MANYTNSIEINKIKVVLLALWDNLNEEDYNKKRHSEAMKIINEFREEIDEINRGN